MNEQFRIEAGEDDRIVGYAESFEEAMQQAEQAHRLSVADGKPEAYHVIHVQEACVQSITKTGQRVG